MTEQHLDIWMNALYSVSLLILSTIAVSARLSPFYTRSNWDPKGFNNLPTFTLVNDFSSQIQSRSRSASPPATKLYPHMHFSILLYSSLWTQDVRLVVLKKWWQLIEASSELIRLGNRSECMWFTICNSLCFYLLCQKSVKMYLHTGSLPCSTL